MRHLYRVAIAASGMVSLAAVSWWTYNAVCWGVKGAFLSVLTRRPDHDGDALMLLWTGCAGLTLTLTWELIARYRSAFPSSREPKRKPLAAKDSRLPTNNC